MRNAANTRLQTQAGHAIPGCSQADPPGRMHNTLRDAGRWRIGSDFSTQMQTGE